ncbi:hypothetical protein KKG65_04115 [Patescibacteria group bacterium]|nr:hypothetical protein [Patescibacteria group bacterium]
MTRKKRDLIPSRAGRRDDRGVPHQSVQDDKGVTVAFGRVFVLTKVRPLLKVRMTEKRTGGPMSKDLYQRRHWDGQLLIQLHKLIL